MTAVLALMPLLALVAGRVYSDVEMTGFKIVQETGNGRWEIRADKAYYDDLGNVVLEKVSARSMSNGADDVTVTSERGRYESAGMILHLEGRVVVESALGSRFEAPHLVWDGPRSLMMADRGIRVERGKLIVRGDGITYAIESGMARVNGDVSTTWIDGRLSP